MAKEFAPRLKHGGGLEGDDLLISRVTCCYAAPSDARSLGRGNVEFCIAHVHHLCLLCAQVFNTPQPHRRGRVQSSWENVDGSPIHAYAVFGEELNRPRINLAFFFLYARRKTLYRVAFEHGNGALQHDGSTVVLFVN